MTGGKSGMTLVEASIVVAFLLLLTAISVPAFIQNQQKKRAAECAMNLDAIEAAGKKYASEKGGLPPKLSSLVPAYLEAIPECPSGGTYALGGAEGEPPACSIPGHHY